MLILKSPLERKPEREYIYHVLLEEFLGIPFEIQFESRSDIQLTEAGCPLNLQLTFSDVFLSQPEEQWLTPLSLPSIPLDVVQDHKGEELPVLYGSHNAEGIYMDMGDKAGSLYCGVDVFGSSFFMLTRYEEEVLPDRDVHGRFPAHASIAFRAAILMRPIVNEYTELVRHLIRRCWPQLPMRERQVRRLMSHDVDAAYYQYGRSRLQMVKEIAGDLLRRHDAEAGWKKAGVMTRSRLQVAGDPFDTYDWLMDLSEEQGIQSAFYFITEQTSSGIDGNYSLADPHIRTLMRRIHARGHEIGLHPTYDSYLDSSRINNQFKQLLNAAEEEHIQQSVWGGRQHYLRWRPATWQHWEDAGLHYDSSLAYAEWAGFRCGVCYEFPVFNVRTRQALKLRERPLIVMEQSILHEQYMGLAGDEAWQMIQKLYRACEQYQGDFTLLWHNSQLVRSSDQSLYQSCLEELHPPFEKVGVL